MTTHLIIAGILLAASLGFGKWLTKAGLPYSTGVLAIHKLTAAASVVFMVLALIAFIKESGNITIVIYLLMGIGGLSALGALGTGGLLSHKKEAAKTQVNMHRITSILLILSILAFFVLIFIK